MRDAVNPEGSGTKAAAHYTFVVASGATETVILRLATMQHDNPFADAEKIFEAREAEATFRKRFFGFLVVWAIAYAVAENVISEGTVVSFKLLQPIEVKM